MSVEGGTISGGISSGATGISAPAASIGGSFEGFSHVSPSISSPDLSGGSMFNSPSAGSLFSETSPFNASIAATPEMSLPKSTDIFSGEFSVLAKPAFQNSEIGTNVQTEPAPKFIMPGFTEFKPATQEVSEGPVSDFLSKEFVIFADNLSQKPEAVLEQTREKTETKASLFTKTEVQKLPVVKVSESQIQTEQAIAGVRGLLLELSNPKKQSAELEPETKVEPISSAKAKAILRLNEILKEEKEVEKDEDEDEDEKKKKKKQTKSTIYNLLKLVIDESAQSARKKTIREKIENTFDQARKEKEEKVSGYQIADGLVEQKKHKSNLLFQLNHPGLPDGSFHEAMEDIGRIGEVKDVSKTAESAVQSKANAILEKAAVELSETQSSKLASEEEYNRVVKFARILSTWI